MTLKWDPNVSFDYIASTDDELAVLRRIVSQGLGGSSTRVADFLLNVTLRDDRETSRKITAEEIASALQVSKPTVYRAVRDLRNAGIISTRNHRRDGSEYRFIAKWPVLVKRRRKIRLKPTRKRA